MNRRQVCLRLEEAILVPVIRAPTSDLARQAVDAIFAGGISVFEITLTVPGATRLMTELAIRFGDRALVGAGSVVSAEEARACLDAGAQFVVSPGFDRETVETVLTRDIAMIPGALTPTEVMVCAKAGADLVKIFPCSAMGGPKYIKALKAPLPNIKLLPTGGVNAATAREYLTAGASALGIGSELVDARALVNQEHHRITEYARQLVAAVQAPCLA